MSRVPHHVILITERPALAGGLEHLLNSYGRELVADWYFDDAADTLRDRNSIPEILDVATRISQTPGHLLADLYTDEEASFQLWLKRPEDQIGVTFRLKDYRLSEVLARKDRLCLTVSVPLIPDMCGDTNGAAFRLLRLLVDAFSPLLLFTAGDHHPSDYLGNARTLEFHRIAHFPAVQITDGGPLFITQSLWQRLAQECQDEVLSLFIPCGEREDLHGRLFRNQFGPGLPMPHHVLARLFDAL